MSRKGNDSHLFYALDDQEYEFPPSVSVITLTMVAGGGCGGTGCIKNSIVYGGGGGGGGESCIKRPIHLREWSDGIHPIHVSVKIGKGGNSSSSSSSTDGGDTMVSFYDFHRELKGMVRVEGGKGAVDINNGGVGGCSGFYFNGSDGDKGSKSMPQYGKTYGGNGGTTVFEKGGLGAFQRSSSSVSLPTKPSHLTCTDLSFQSYQERWDNSLSSNGKNGWLGSGGGGSVYQSTPVKGGNGGDGFVIIEY